MAFWQNIDDALSGRDRAEELRRSIKYFEDVKWEIKSQRWMIHIVFFVFALILSCLAYFNVIEFGLLYRVLALSIVGLYVLVSCGHLAGTSEQREQLKAFRKSQGLHGGSSIFASGLGLIFWGSLDLLLPVMGWNWKAILQQPWSATLDSLQKLFLG